MADDIDAAWEDVAQASELRRLIRIARRQHFKVCLDVAGERVELPRSLVISLDNLASIIERSGAILADLQRSTKGS
jgi:hypothetical protein